MRPTAWRISAVLELNQSVTFMEFLPSGRLLAIGPTRAAVYDLTRGKLEASLGESEAGIWKADDFGGMGTRWTVLSNGTELLSLPPRWPGKAELFELPSMKLRAAISVPGDFAGAFWMTDSSADRRFLSAFHYIYYPPRGTLPKFGLWEITEGKAGEWELKLNHVFPRVEIGYFSPDTKQLLLSPDKYAEEKSGIYDAVTGDHLQILPRWDRVERSELFSLPNFPKYPRDIRFTASGREVAISSAQVNGNSRGYSLFDMQSGKLVGSANWPVNFRAGGIAGDGETLVSHGGPVVQWNRASKTWSTVRASYWLEFTSLRNKQTHRINGVGGHWVFQPLPDHRRFVGPGLEYDWDTLCTYDTRSGTRLSTLRLPLHRVDMTKLEIATEPTGNRIAVRIGGENSTSDVTIFEQVGPDTSLGALGLPWVWAAIVGFCAMAASLWVDARRGGSQNYPERRLLGIPISAIILTIAGILCLQLLLISAVGELRAPAALWAMPPMVFCGIGLAINSRFWRWIAAIALASEMSVLGWGAYNTWKTVGAEKANVMLVEHIIRVPSNIPITVLAAGAVSCLALLLAATWRKRA